MIDFTKLTPAQLERFIHMQKVIDLQSEEFTTLQLYRDYYKGDHEVFLTDRQSQYLGNIITDPNINFSHNICRLVVDTYRERLNLTGVTVTDDTEEGDLASLLWSYITDNNLLLQQIKLYRRALRDGEGYLMVSYDNVERRPVIKVHKKFDGSTGIVVHYNPEEEDEVAFYTRYFFTSFSPVESPLQALNDSGEYRKTVYLPHEVRKYRQSNAVSGGWELLEAIPWTDTGTENGTPLGLTLIPFTAEGSLLSNIIGFQDALNKLWLDLLAAADSQGFPLLAMNYSGDTPFDLNVDDDDDLEGDDEFYLSPMRAIEIYGGKVERIPSGDLSQLINAIRTTLSAISSSTRVPQHIFVATSGVDNVSGETLRQMERPLVKRILEKQMLFGASWRKVLQIAYKLDSVFGDQPQDVRIDPTLSWESVEAKSPVEDMQVAQGHKTLGVPNSEIWAILGYTPEQIIEFEQSSITTIANIAQAINVQNTQNTPQTNPDTNLGGL